MRTLSFLLVSIALTLSSPAAEKADLVVYGDIYTVNAARNWADAMAVREGKIVYVGPADGAKSLVGDETKVVKTPP